MTCADQKARRSRSRRLKLIWAVSCSLSLLPLAGCGGKPFNVQPRPAIPHAINGAGVEVNGISLQAEAVTDENLLYDTFDANLILAGILPVRVKLTNSGSQPFEIKRARFFVRGPGDRTYKAMEAERAYKRLISFYGIGTYNKEGYKESRADFVSYELNTSEPLGAEESRQGILFFPVPDEEIRAGGLTLVARRLDTEGSKSDSDVEIRLN